MQAKTDLISEFKVNTVEGVAELVCPPFSNTTAVEDIAQKITIMDICKNYFDYKCMTMCGFPEVSLEGTEADWRMLKEECLRSEVEAVAKMKHYFNLNRFRFTQIQIGKTINLK